MIKQDFINTEIKGTESYILTEFEFLVKEMANNVDKELLKKAFKRGLEIEKECNQLKDLTNEQLLQELNKALKKLSDKLSEDLDEDYDD